jgi:hypothetical protein
MVLLQQMQKKLVNEKRLTQAQMDSILRKGRKRKSLKQASAQQVFSFYPL